MGKLDVNRRGRQTHYKTYNFISIEPQLGFKKNVYTHKG